MDQGALRKDRDRFRVSGPRRRLDYPADQCNVGCVHRRYICGRIRAGRGNQVPQIRGDISPGLRSGASVEEFGRLGPFSQGSPGTHHDFQLACGTIYQ